MIDCTQPGTECDEATGTCVPGGGCDDFEAAVAAIVNMTTVYTDQIRFGLSLFPDTVTPSCVQ